MRGRSIELRRNRQGEVGIDSTSDVCALWALPSHLVEQPDKLASSYVKRWPEECAPRFRTARTHLPQAQIIWKTTRTTHANCLVRSNTPNRFWNQRYYAVTLVVTPT